MIVLVTLAVLFPIAGGDFVAWDDHDTIARNPLLNPASTPHFVRHWTTLNQGNLYIPVTYSLWHAVATLTQRAEKGPDGLTLSGVPFSLVNLLVHVAATLLVFELLRRLIGPERPAAVAASAAGALLFALHPVQIDSVGWISGLKDVLSTTLLLAALLVYVRLAQDEPTLSPTAWRWRYAAVVTLAAAAMLSKPTAMVLPAMAFAIDWLVIGRPWKTALARSAPLLALTVPTAIVTRIVQSSGHVSTLVPLVHRPLVAMDALAFYLGKLAWPTNLTIDHGRTPRSVLESGAIWWTWVAPAAVTLLAVLLRRRLPLLAAGLVLAVLPLTPVLGIVPFDFQYISGVAEHYLYPAMFGIALIAAAVLVRIERINGIAAIALLVLTPLAVLSHRQAWVWSDTETLMTHVRSVNPSSWLARNNLASHYLDIATASEDPLERAGAVELGERLSREAIALRDDYALAHNNLGLALFLRARHESDPARRRELLRDAARAIRASLDLAAKNREPTDVATLINAAEISGFRSALEERDGDFSDAVRWLDASIATFERVLKADPANAFARDRIAGATTYRATLAERAAATQPTATQPGETQAPAR